MKTFTLVLAIVFAQLGQADITTFIAHADKAEMDQSASTKVLGILRWQHFFQKYVDWLTVAQP